MTLSSPRPVLSVVTSLTPARKCVASTVMWSSPEPVQIVIPPAKLPVAAAVIEIPACANPVRYRSAVGVSVIVGLAAAPRCGHA